MAARGHWAQVRRLLFAFGIFGLAVWPAVGWLGYDLIAGELERLRGLHVTRSTLIGRDFVNVWHAGREALEGAAGIYDRDAYRRTLFEAAGVRGIYAFSYPPHMLMLAIPFGLAAYPWSLAIWTLAGLTLFACAARPWLSEAKLPIWSTALLPGLWVNLWAGHFGALIGALALYGWRRAGRDPARAGASFALMSVKPHMGVLVPLVLALRRDWRTIAVAAAGVATLALASLLAFGASAWTTWFSSTLTFQAGLVEASPANEYGYMMPTAGGMMRWVTADRTLALLGQAAFALAAIALLLWAAARKAALAELGLLSLAATPLLLPYSFDYDMVALSLAALLWAARSPARWYAPERLAYAAAFVVPLAQAPLAHEGVWLSPPALLAALGFAAWRAGARAAEPDA